MSKILLALIAVLCLTGVCFAQAPDATAFIAVGPGNLEEWSKELLDGVIYTSAPAAASAFAVVQEGSQVRAPEQKPSSAPPALPSRHSHEQSPVQKGHYSQPVLQYQWYYSAPPPRQGWFGRSRGTGPVRRLLGLGGC